MRHFFRTLLFLAVGLLIFVAFNLVLQPVWLSWNNFHTTHDFYKQPDHTIEAVFLGASIVTTGINPEKLYEDYGICSYNLGSEQQPVMASYFRLEETYRLHGNSLKSVILETSMFRKTPPREVYHKSLDFLKWSDVKVEALNALSKSSGNPLFFELPIAVYHERWHTLTEADYIGLTKSEENGTRGFMPSVNRYEFVVENANYPEDQYFYPNYVCNTEAEPMELDIEAIRYYKKIVEFCREHGLKLTLYRSPAVNWNSSAHNAVAALSEADAVPFYDFNFYPLSDEIEIYPFADSIDSVHLNTFGASNLARWFGRYLTTECGVSDIRNKPEYAFMESELNLYKENDGAKKELSVINDPVKYISYAASIKNCAVFLSVSDEASNHLTDNQRSALEKLGLKELSELGFWDSYLAVICDGKVQYEARHEGPKPEGEEDAAAGNAENVTDAADTGNAGNSKSATDTGNAENAVDVEKTGNAESAADAENSESVADARNLDIPHSETLIENDTNFSYQGSQGLANSDANIAGAEGTGLASLEDNVAGTDSTGLASLDVNAAGAEGTGLASLEDNAAGTDNTGRASSSGAVTGTVGADGNTKSKTETKTNTKTETETEAESKNPHELRYENTLPLGQEYVLRSCGTSDSHLTSCVIDDEEYSADGRGLNIVVYNYASDSVVDSCSFDTYASAERNADYFLRGKKLLAYSEVNLDYLDRDTRKVYRYCLRCKDKELTQLLRADLTQADLFKYLEAYTKDRRFVIYLAANDDAAYSLTDESREYAAGLGLTEFSELKHRSSYLAVIDGGEVIYEEKDRGKQPISYIYLDTHKIVSGGRKSKTPASIKINGKEYCPKGRGINIVVYDKMSESVVDTMRFDTHAHEPSVPGIIDEAGEAAAETTSGAKRKADAAGEVAAETTSGTKRKADAAETGEDAKNESGEAEAKTETETEAEINTATAETEAKSKRKAGAKRKADVAETGEEAKTATEEAEG